MSWLRRLLLLAGLVTGAWLLGGAGEAHADVEVELDSLKVRVELPIVEIGVQIHTGLTPQQPQAPAPAPTPPAPRTEPPAAPQQAVLQPPVGKPVHVEAPEPRPQPAQPTRPVTRSESPVPVPEQPQPQPQAELPEPPLNGTLPQSGAGQSGGTQIPVGTLPGVTRPPTSTTSVVSADEHDVPRTLRAEEPTFSPD